MCFGHRSKKLPFLNSHSNNHYPYATPTSISCPTQPQPQPRSMLPPSVLPTSAPTHRESETRDKPSTTNTSTSFLPPADPPPPFTPYTSTNTLPPPPPPVISYDESPLSNAPGYLSDAGYAYCHAHPLTPPQRLSGHALARIQRGVDDIGFGPPPAFFRGTVDGANVSTHAECPDTTLLSALPLYAAGYHHPGNTRLPRSIYFEVEILRMPAGAAVAVGFAATPYPAFRLPGWNRGSLGVHADDGRRYCNDSYGGKGFVRPWREGETVGIGMGFLSGEVWFTRDGRREDGWSLDEEIDAERDWDPRIGLDGGYDVYAALGLWGGGLVVSVKKLESS